MAIKIMNNEEKWFNKIQERVERIRSWAEWQTSPLDIMKTEKGTDKQGVLALYSYQSYVRRFTIIMCSVMAKVPDADSRFWRLAINLYDELGEKNGLTLAHGKLLERITQSELIDKSEADNCREKISPLEKKMFNLITGSDWCFNLFALGPGTESISDLFLDPLEHWSSKAVKSNSLIKKYFELHYPSVEFEHQLEISKILAEELSKKSIEEANSMFSKGMDIAEKIARIHLEATKICWTNSASNYEMVL